MLIQPITGLRGDQVSLRKESSGETLYFVSSFRWSRVKPSKTTRVMDVKLGPGLQAKSFVHWFPLTS